MSYDVQSVASQIAALVKERHLDPYATIGATYLMDYASGAVALPVGSRGAMRRLCEALRVEPRWLYGICDMQVPTPAAKKEPVVVEEAAPAQKPDRKSNALENRSPKPAPVQQPDRIYCDACGVNKPIAEYSTRLGGSTCRICISDQKAARRKERRKAAYEAKKLAEADAPIFGSWCISWK
jgi:hypothetical protein